MYWVGLAVVVLILVWYMTKDNYMEYRDVDGKIMDKNIKKVGNLVFGGEGGKEKMGPFSEFIAHLILPTHLTALKQP